jgi:hypothetical protein
MCILWGDSLISIAGSKVSFDATNFFFGGGYFFRVIYFEEKLMRGRILDPVLFVFGQKVALFLLLFESYIEDT